MRKLRGTLIVTCTLLTSLFLGVVNLTTEEASAYTPHNPIRIRNNGEFTIANGVTGGTGIPSDPYLIEGWEIDASSQVGVWIWDTDAYFTIRTVYIHSGSFSFHAIILENVTNFRIEDANLSDNAAGVHLIDSYNGAIIGNNVSMNDWGIGLVQSINVTITGNTFEKNGVRLWGEIASHYDSHNITTDNLVNGLPVYYFKNCNNINIDSIPVGQLIVASCVDVSAVGLQFTEADAGIQMAFVNNALIDSNNASLSNQGISVWFSAHVNITNNSVYRNGYNGIGIHSSNNSTITGNHAIDNQKGIYLYDSDHVNITSNEAIDNRFGISLWVNGYVTIANNVVSKREKGIILQYSNNSFILENNVSGENSGIWLHDSHDNLIRNNTASASFSFGVDLVYSNRNRIINNTVSNGLHGIRLDFSNRNLVHSNTVTGIQDGIRLWNSNINTISNNSALNNQNGIEVYDSRDNTIANNTVNSSTARGITLSGSNDTLVYHNNIIQNAIQAIDNWKTNQWDDGYPSGGNYWSDYVGLDDCSGPNQDICPDPDEIGDTPYDIDADSRDRYPLMHPFGTVVPQPMAILSTVLSGWNSENVTLTWSLSPDDGQGNKSIVGYEIYRNMTYDPQGLGYALIASVPNGTSEYVDILAGEGDPNNYFYRLCAFDLGGNRTCAERQGGKFARQLSKGFNLVSIPLFQSNASTDKVLQTVEFDKVWTYDSFSREWKSYMVSKPYTGDLTRINHTIGMWVNVVEESNLTVAGIVPRQTYIQLHEGWNLVGFPSFKQDYTVADLKAALPIDRVEGFDATASPYFLKLLQDSDVLLAGQAYWLRASGDAIWTLSNT